MDDTSMNAAEAGQQINAELNDMTPYEVYDAYRAGQFNGGDQ